jgi:peptidyl-prolyl cis-trans isomerase B (cyclophilin B)
MTDLERLFHDAAALAEEGHLSPADPLGRLRIQSANRRRRRAMLAVPAAAAAVAAIAVVPSMLPRGGNSRIVPADGSSVAAAESPATCTASGGGSCAPALESSPDPTTATGDTCAYKATPQDDATPRYSPTTVGRAVGLPPTTPSDLPSVANIHTNRGDITVSLRGQTACTVNSFAHLVRHAYYDKTPCFRLTTAGIYVLQCGDPSGKGTGGPGYVYDDESLPGTTYPAGTIAMANSGPRTNGSQFFLVYEDTQLDPNYTVFGRITAGLDVLKEIAAGGSVPSNDGHPKLSVQIETVTVG